jgi:hypothetical protein
MHATQVGLLATKDYVLTGVRPELFSAISRDEFLLCVLGFLTHRLSIFANEVTLFKPSDVREFMCFERIWTHSDVCTRVEVYVCPPDVNAT